MALTKAEQLELEQLNSEAAQKSAPVSKLTASEQAELDQLNKEAGIAQTPQEIAPQEKTGLQTLVDPSLWGATAQGIVQSVTGGLYNPISAGIQAPLKAIQQGDLSIGGVKKGYEQARAEQEGLANKYPGATIASELAGAVNPYSAASKIFQGAKLATEAIPLAAASKYTPLLKSSAAMGLGSAGIAAETMGARGIEDPEKIIEDTLSATAIGAALPIGGKALMYAGKGISEAAKKGASSLLNLRKEAVEKYLVNSERINKAPSKEALVSEVDNYVAQLKSDVEGGQINLQQSRDALKAKVEEVKTISRDKGIELGNALDKAENNLLNKRNEIKLGLTNKKSLSNNAEAVDASLNNLKTKVVSGSNESMGILEQSGAGVSSKSITDRINQELADLNKPGKIGPQFDDARIKLAAIKEKISGMGEKKLAQAGTGEELTNIASKLQNEAHPADILDAPTSKELIKSLDDMASYGMAPGQFNKPLDNAIKNIRRHIDGIIKNQSPEYAEKMKEVAKNTNLLKKSTEVFRGGDKTASALKNIENKPFGQNLLSALGKETGVNYAPLINKSKQAGRILESREAMQKLDKFTPEYKASRQAALDLETHKLGTKAVQQAALEGPVKQYTDAISSLKKAQRDYNSVRNANTDTSQRFMSTLGKTNRDVFKKLSALSGKDFITAMEDRAVLETFEKEAGAGSRNVNLWGALLGGGYGAVHGGFGGGGMGIAAGAVIGSIVDKIGPKIAKQVIDASIKFNRLPTVQEITSMEIPDAAKAYLASQLKEYTKEKK